MQNNEFHNDKGLRETTESIDDKRLIHLSAELKRFF